MSNISRRNFLAASAAAASIAGLAACNNAAEQPAEETPAGSGYTEETTEDGYVVVTQEGGPQLSYSPDSGMKIIEVDGHAFKDFEGTGELAPYADWRLTSEERAADLAARLTIEQISGLMCFSAHQRQLDDVIEVNDDQKAFLGDHVRAILNAMSGFPAFQQADWSNKIQAYVEASDNKIPALFSSDPRNGKNCADWPNNIALAATFDPAVAREAGEGIASDLRHMGVTMFLGPQVDVASDPRWARFNGTFGEDPALSRDMCRSLIDGLQSTMVNGEDQGWGTGSVASMIKHWPAEGAGEGGREGHTDGGKFAVYPTDNFDALMIPFVDGGFKLEGKTGCAATIMTSYTIAYDENKKYGELVGSGFSEYKMNLLRDTYGFKGAACTDWMVQRDPGDSLAWTCWGLEDTNEWNPDKRCAKAVEVGVDQIGGCNEPSQLVAAFEAMKDSLGEDQAKANFQASAERLLLSYFNTGLFEDPYVSVSAARAEVDKAPDDVTAAALAAQVKGIVMLKNENGAIKAGSEDSKLKAYIPVRFTPAATSANGMGVLKWSTKDATAELPITKGTADKYFDVVTDTIADTLTGPADKDGNPTAAEADITRLTAADIADVDVVIVPAVAPANASSRRGQDENGDFIPLSIQYRPYTADNEYVRKESIAGDILADGTKENRSYFGRTSMITNEAQLDQILAAAALAKEAGKPCIVILNITQPMCVHEFESEVDAIVVSMSGSAEAACRVVAGLDEPSGLLPMQMPKDMLDVEKQAEDASRDMECYTDAAGNKYDFGFGLNYAGPISDDRTAKYCVPVLTKPEA